MSSKRKSNPDQPELPIEELPDNTPGTVNAAPVPKGGNGEAPTAKPAKGGNGASHVLAENVAAPAPTRPFVPGKIELPLHRRVDRSFLEYASYVIRDRAIPNLADGLKPVQRRILWALHEKDDGRFIKVANVVGHAMQYHPHGDASIGDALVVLANKRYLIEGQGNFGNIFTGDLAAAPRYIECRLTELARNGGLQRRDHRVRSQLRRAQQGTRRPALQTAPHCLMLGTEGIAVGMSSRILPHNFPELLQAQIAILKKQPFKCLPDFPTGGLMDARDYRDGKGRSRSAPRSRSRTIPRWSSRKSRPRPPPNR